MLLSIDFLEALLYTRGKIKMGPATVFVVITLKEDAV